MLASIPDAPWQVDASDPTALTRLLNLPDLRVTGLQFNDQVSAARRDLQRELSEEAKKTLKGCRWLLVRNEADLSAEEKAKLQQMFAVSPVLKQLHTLKEDFRAIFETQQSLESASARLEAWIVAVETSGLTKLTKFVGTLRRRFEHIVNYFSNRLTSGRVEGLNNKVKVIKRCAYGFRNFEHFALRIRVECDGGI